MRPEKKRHYQQTVVIAELQQIVPKMTF